MQKNGQMQIAGVPSWTTAFGEENGRQVMRQTYSERVTLFADMQDGRGAICLDGKPVRRFRRFTNRSINICLLAARIAIKNKQQ